MADVVWTETEGQVQDRLRAQVARLEDELAIRKGAQAKLGEEWEYEQDRANDAQAANAAKDAALRPFAGCLRATTVAWALDRTRVDDLPLRAFHDARAALSGTGKGWVPPEMREQARLAIGHAFHLIEHNKAMCVRCREAKRRLSAALAKLEEK